MRGWVDALEKAITLGCPLPDEIDALAEIKATRDLLEHNAGVVNATYQRKAGKLARYAVGEAIQLDDAYVLQSWRVLRKIAGDVSSSALAKLAAP